MFALLEAFAPATRLSACVVDVLLATVIAIDVLRNHCCVRQWSVVATTPVTGLASSQAVDLIRHPAMRQSNLGMDRLHYSVHAQSVA